MAATVAAAFDGKSLFRAADRMEAMGATAASIVLKPTRAPTISSSLYYEPNLRAKRGGHGQGKDKHGRNGESLIVKVPIGTMVFRLPEEFHPHMADPRWRRKLEPSPAGLARTRASR